MVYRANERSGCLKHYGRLGQKWGVRKYQYKDGTLTPEGKKRYANDAKKKGYDIHDEDSGAYYKNSKKNGMIKLKADPNRYVTEDMTNVKNMLNVSSNIVKNIGNSINKPSKAKTNIDLSHMTDKELRDAINRKLLEKQYSDLYSTQTESKGKRYVSNILKYAGAALSTAGSTVGLAVSIRELIK